MIVTIGMSMSSSIILLPCNNHLAMEQFNSTVRDGVSFDRLGALMDSDDSRNLSKIGPMLHVWGLSKSNYEGSLFWDFLKIGDHAIFYTKSRLFFHARICHKCKDAQLSRAIWGENPIGGNWELLLFFDSCEPLDVIMDEDILRVPPFSSTPILFKSNDEVVDHIFELIGADDDEGNIMFSKRREKQINDYIDSRLDSLQGPIDVDDIDIKVKKISNISNEELIREASKEKTPKLTKTSTYQYSRDEYVRLYALRRAGDNCQLCLQKAPFSRSDGSPYLEVHHIVPLSQGGSDSIDNVCALCPNCHRKMHIIADSDDVSKLLKTAEKRL